MRTVRLFVLCLLLTCVAFATAPPQNQVQPVPVFRTRVDVVVLDVSVLDSDRRPIRGLTAEDFTVLEDGRPQKITMFSAVDLPDPVEPPTPWIREVSPDVRSNEDDNNASLVIILMDDANPMDAGDLAYARQHARTIVDHLGPHDLAAVAFLADARSGQEFTHDRARLLAAIDRFNGPGKLPQGAGPASIGALELLGPTMALRSLKGQAEALMDLPAARKSLIFISTRGAALPDLVTGQGDAEGQAATPGQDTAGMGIQNFGEFGEYVRAAQRANLNVYCLDPGGLRAPKVFSTPFSTTASTTFSRNTNVTGIASLKALSTNTGGFPIVETNDPKPGIDQAFRENRSYYLLAYASPNSRTEGRFRRVVVKVNRPDVTVRSRYGYFEPEKKELKKAAVPSSPAATLLAGTVAKADIPMQLTAAPFALPGGKQAAVAIVLALRQAAPQAAARFKTFDVTVNAYDYRARLQASDRFQARATLRPGVAEIVGFEVVSRLDLTPGRYQLRVAASEARSFNTKNAADISGPPKTGSVYYDLDVPDFAAEPLSLSGVVFAVANAPASGASKRFGSLLPIVPTTVREFQADDHVPAFLRVYQGASRVVGTVALTTRIVDGAGATAFATTETLPSAAFAKTHAADYQLALPLDRLKSGAYLLTVEAKIADRTAQRDIRFSVR